MNRWKHFLTAMIAGMLMAVAFGETNELSQQTAGSSSNQSKLSPSDEREAFFALRKRASSGEPLSLSEKTDLKRLAVKYNDRRGRDSHLDNIVGPDDYGYVFVDNQGGDTASFRWIELRGDPLAIWVNNWELDNRDDGISVDTFPIGFDFPFYGEIYSSFSVCVNGHIQFTTRSQRWWDMCLPVEDTGPSIYLYGEDLHSDYGGIPGGLDIIGIRNFENYLVIEYDSIGHCCEDGASFKFEAILFPDGRIKLQYLYFSYGTQEWWDSSGTIGIQASGTGPHLQYLCDEEGIRAVDSLAIWIQRPQGIPTRITDLQILANGTTVSMVWTDPITDIHGNPIVVDSVQVLRDGVRTGVALPGVQYFSQTNVPTGMRTYGFRAYHGGWSSGLAHATVMVGNPSYYENFDLTNGGWQSMFGWEWGPPANTEPHSAPNCWGNRLNGTYTDNACEEIRFNPGLQVVNTNAAVEFFCWYESEEWADGVNFQYSVDGDSTWIILLPSEHEYDVPSSGNMCIFENPMWSGRTDGWQFVRIPLGHLVGQTPSFRFLFGTDFSIVLPGFMFDDMAMWGLSSPAGVPVSGTVTLDGGSGSLTDVVLRADGIGSPSISPNAAGIFTLPNVQTGNRVISASLLRYGTAVQTVTVPPGGVTGLQITLRRSPPPMLSGLTATQDTSGQFVALDWNNSTDPSIDFYRVYRKAQTDSMWTAVQTSIISQAFDTLTIWNAYQYTVTAVDVNVTPPAVESPFSPSVLVLYGAVPPSGLIADGHHDTFIHLQWRRPGEGAAPVSLQYDDGTVEQWIQIHSPNKQSDYFAVRFELPQVSDEFEYPLPLRACNIFLQNQTPLPNIWLCRDAHGRPEMNSPLEHWTDFMAESAPGWLTLPASATTTFSNPEEVWLVWQQPEGSNQGVGTDQSATPSHSFFSNNGDEWHSIADAGLICRLWLGGEDIGTPNIIGNAADYFAGQLPLRLLTDPNRPDVATADAAKKENRGPIASRENPVSFISGVTPSLPAQAEEPYLEVPQLEYESRDRSTSTLDDPNYYIVYRDSLDIAHPTAVTYDDFVAEGTAHQYYITAHYPNGLESMPSNTISAMAAMAPGMPRNISGTRLDAHRIRINWTDPTTNEDRSPCTDLAGIQVFRNDTLIATVAAGAMRYVDTPPFPNRINRWTLRGIDEVPNVGPGRTYYGSVIDQWQETAFQWIDISATGIPIDLCDDCISDMLPISFPYEFYGDHYESLRIAANGFVSFMDTWSPSGNDTCPSVNEPNNAIYGMWNDLNPDAGGDVFYYSDSAAGVFVVSYINVPIFATDDNQTFQIILHRGGVVSINYLNVGDISSCTVGAENENGSIGFSILYNGWYTDNDFTIADSTSLEIWGAMPQFCSVTGTVSLDGGAGVLTAVTVKANGASHPTTHPNISGSYLLRDVIVGNRTLTASLDGYHKAISHVMIPDTHGLTNQNFILRRTNPPAPTGLVYTLNEITGRDSLHWDVSPDVLVDYYRVYRRLHSDSIWTLIRTIPSRTQTWAIDTLTADGIYQYSVTAVDSNVILPAVESDRSRAITILFGDLPPSALIADGNYDNKIRLSWFPPGVYDETEVYYDHVGEDPWTCIWGGHGFWEQPPFGWCAAHFQSSGLTRISRIKVHFFEWASNNLPYEVGVFADDGSGLPTFTPLSVTPATLTDPDQWEDIELVTPVDIASGSFFVGIRQTTRDFLGLGIDYCTSTPPNTFFFASDANEMWQVIDTTFGGVFCLRAIVRGNFDTEPVLLSPSPVSTARQATYTTPTVHSKTRNNIETGKRTDDVQTKNLKTESVHKSSLARLETWVKTTSEHHSVRQMVKPYISLNDDRGRHTLDEVARYRIYYDGVALDSVLGNTLFYNHIGLIENQPHTYFVTAVYPSGETSPPTNTVTTSCNMPPGAPTDILLTPVGTHQMRIQWTNPTVNRDGTPCADLAGLRIYRDSQLIGDVLPAVGQFLDTPPDEMTFYTWEVRGYDEVPNEGPGAAKRGVVVSPWRVIDYEWQEVWNISTPVVECSFCASEQIDLGFNFLFYGVPYQSVYINSNGYLSFENPYGWTAIDPIPNIWEPNAVIYGFSSVLDPSNGTCRYYADPNGSRFIVTWRDCPHMWDPNLRETFQIILEPENGIVLNYQSVSDASWCLIGVENQDGSDGLQLYLTGNGEFVPTSLSAVGFWGGPRSSIIGTIRAFGNSQPIPGVSVWATGAPDTVFSATDGTYELPLDDGTYAVHFHHPTFCDSIIGNVVVAPGEELPLHVVLRAPAAGFSHSSVALFTPVGVNAQMNFMLSNPGGQCPLSFTVSDTSAWLSVTPASGQVNPNQSVTLSVAANVQGIPINGERHSSFVIAHNAANIPRTITVDLYVTSMTADDKSVLPTEYAFYPNYPNPFNATTTFAFDLPQESAVTLVIYNLNGQEVARPVTGNWAAGRYHVAFRAVDLPSGMYLVQITAGYFQAVGKMLLLK